MKNKVIRFFQYSLIQIKQITGHRTRFIMLLCSLTFSFTLLLVFVFSALTFGRYTYWSAKTNSEITVYQTANIYKVDADGNNIFSIEKFVTTIDELAENGVVSDSMICYETADSELPMVIYGTIEEQLSFEIYDLNDMHLSPADEAKTRSFGINNFLYGGYPQTNDEVVLSQKYAALLGIDYQKIKSDEEIYLNIENRNYTLSGITDPNGIINGKAFLPKTSFAGKTTLSYAKFSFENSSAMSSFENLLSAKQITAEETPDSKSIVGTMVMMEILLIIMTIGITLVSLLMYYSNFKSLIKESRKQTALSYYLGRTKNKAIGDMTFKVCFIGTVSFLCSAIFSTIIGYVISTQKNLIFGGIPLYNIAMPNIFGLIIGYVIGTGLLILIFRRSIRKSLINLPNSFGGNL